MVLKSSNFVVSLFCTIFKYRIVIAFLFCNAWTWKIIRKYYTDLPQKYLIRNNFTHFQQFLTVLVILRSVWLLLSVRSCTMWRTVTWHLMKISWLTPPWCRFLMRDAFEQTFILVLILLLMLLLPVIWILTHVKWNFITFTAIKWFNYF